MTDPKSDNSLINTDEIKPIETSIEDIKSSEENRQGALELAQAVQDRIGSNWFTLRRFQNKLSLSRKDTEHKLYFLRLFDLIQVKIGDFKGESLPMFKITIPVEDKIKALDQIIEYHQDQIRLLSIRKNSLIEKVS